MTRLCLLLGGLAVLCATPLFGMERVDLRNGFSYDCVRREELPDGRVRLYLFGGDPASSLATGNAPSVPVTAAASPVTTNYIDLSADRIASIETLPDPPPAAAPHAAGPALATLDVPSLLAHAGLAHNIDAELLASIVHAESGGRVAAVSRTGARGLMQLMPGTARDLQVRDVLNARDNVDGGTAYLDLLLARYHEDLALALAAYNAGPAAVDRFHGIPPFRETRAYVARVLTEFKRRKAALQASSPQTASLAKF